MNASARHLAAKPDPSSVLTKAVARAAERLGISRALLAKILGVSPPTVTRLYNGNYKLDDRRKEWEFALLFVRVYRSLDSIVGNEQTARQWLNSENRGLNGRPVDLICQTEGPRGQRRWHFVSVSTGSPALVVPGVADASGLCQTQTACRAADLVPGRLTA